MLSSMFGLPTIAKLRRSMCLRGNAGEDAELVDILME